jgi:hypothetical protein
MAITQISSSKIDKKRITPRLGLIIIMAYKNHGASPNANDYAPIGAKIQA